MKARKIGVASIAALGISLGLASPAFADAVSPPVAACQGKAVGAACDGSNGAASGSGRCAAIKCQRADIANWDRDASPSPPVVSYDCLSCVYLGGDLDGGSTTLDGGSRTADGGTTSPSSSSGCSVAMQRSNWFRAIGPWLLAAIVPLALRRRRTRR